MPTLDGPVFLALFSLLTFAAVVLLVFGLWLGWSDTHGPEARRRAARLRILQPDVQVNPVSDARRGDAGSHSTGSGARYRTGSWGGIAAALRRLRDFDPRRRRKLRSQLPDALDFMARALRAGHALQSAMKMAGEELPQPIGAAFADTHDEIKFGVPLPQALERLCHRVPGPETRFFTIAVIIHRESGGNLTEVMGNLSRLIRERLRFAARVKVLTAEGRLSAWTLGLMPFILAGLMQWGNPEFIAVLWQDPLGGDITRATLAVMALGGVWLWRLTRIRA